MTQSHSELMLELSLGIQVFCYLIPNFYISVKNPDSIKNQTSFGHIKHDSINKKFNSSGVFPENIYYLKQELGVVRQMQ